MAVRAIWKGVLTFGEAAIPVKLFSAVEDRSVRFRLLHEKDHQPVKQVLVNPHTHEVMPHAQARRAYYGEEAEVLLSNEELAAVRPASSRIIEVLRFLPPQVIDHRWYDRPYYLGPDGSEQDYAALAGALEQQQYEGLAYWVMRNKEFYGALRLFQGYPMLMSLRYAGQVVNADELQPPTGKPLDERELDLAADLIDRLGEDFNPGAYRDEYRERVMEMIEKKRKGGRVRAPAKPETRERPTEDLTRALEASLKQVSHG